MKILLVSYEFMVRHPVKVAFRRIGHDVVEASCVGQAIDVINDNRDIDRIMIDMHLDSPLGAELVVSHARKVCTSPDLKICVVDGDLDGCETIYGPFGLQELRQILCI